MTLVGYVVRDLFRNPRRTLASVVGVIVGVGLFSAVLFFIDGSGASMTRRAIAPLSVDMQRVLTTPLGGGISLEQQISELSLDAGATTVVTLTVSNDGLAPSHEVVVRDRPRSPFAYVPGSTTLDGAAVGDIDGGIPLSQGYAGVGLNIGTVGSGASHQITYQVSATQSVRATSDLPVHATISTREALTPVRASAPRPATLASLAERVGRIPGIDAADPLVFVDMNDGSISAQGVHVPGPVRLFAFDATYQAHYPSIKVLEGRIRPGDAMISAETARALHIGVGETVSLGLPTRAAPVSLRVSGITDLSGAKPLFESREASSLEHFLYVPYTIVVDHDLYGERIAPAFEAAIAARDASLISVPLQELDVSIDRGILNADPATALDQTRAISKEIAGVASDQDYLVDNISNTLQVAEGDASIAKRMFIFLGLPGAILAAILTAYAGALLAESQRRENALLRVRGANRRHLLSLLGLRTIATAGVGSLVGAALGFAAVVALLGRSVLFEASNGALMQSALIGVFGGMAVTAFALYIPGRRLITQEIKAELAVIERLSTPRWRRYHLDVATLLVAVVAQGIALRRGAFDIPAGSVYAGESVSLPLYLLGPPIVAWVAGPVLISRVLSAITARAASSRSTVRFERLVPGVLWRSITRRLRSMTSGVATVGLVVGLGTMLVCFSTVYDRAKAADARFLVGSDIRVTPNPTSGVAHPVDLAADFQVDGVTGTTAVVYSPENAVLTSAFNEDVATLAAIDPRVFPQVGALQDSSFSDGTAADNMLAMQQQPDGILVNSALAEGLKLKIGDKAKIMFARGTDQQTRTDATVVGLFTQFPGAPEGTDIVADLVYYEGQSGLAQADYYLVSVADPSTTGLQRTVDALSAGEGFSRDFVVQTSAVAVDKDRSSLTGLNVLGLLQLDSFFTFLMAATATGMFVFGLLLQRRREYVTLRAQGLHSREVRRLVLAES
ncbi:MAG: ABC transporter permease, partial [Actinomycetota bacterium]